MTSISENYQALQSTWEAAKQATKDIEMRARIIGVASQMKKFDFFFGVELGRKCLSMIDNLSQSLQAATIPAYEGQGFVKKTVQSLQSIRSDENFESTLNTGVLKLMYPLLHFHAVKEFHEDLK